jgi:hypothetical protein
MMNLDIELARLRADRDHAKTLVQRELAQHGLRTDEVVRHATGHYLGGLRRRVLFVGALGRLATCIAEGRDEMSSVMDIAHAHPDVHDRDAIVDQLLDAWGECRMPVVLH